MAKHDKIDPDQVEALAALHCTMKEIAAFFKVHVDTIRDHFSNEIQKGKELGKIKLRRAQWKAAEKGNTAILIFLGKQYLGQSDRAEQVVQSEITLQTLVPALTKEQALALLKARQEEEENRALPKTD